MNMENSNSGVELCLHNKKKNDTLSSSCLLDKVIQNDNQRNGLRLADETVHLFRKYLLTRTQHNNGKNTMEETQVVKKSSRPLSRQKFGRTNLSRPMSLLEQELFPTLSCRTKQSRVEKKTTSTKQLTIFYDGEVSVYDNVSAKKAEEIMVLASESSSSTPVNREELEASNLDSVWKRKEGPPSTRKYSPHRFIEKRRERIIEKFPYSRPSSPSQDDEEKESIREKGGGNENHCSSLSPFPHFFSCFS